MEYQWSKSYSIGIRLCVLDNPPKKEKKMHSIVKAFISGHVWVRLLAMVWISHDGSCLGFLCLGCFKNFVVRL